MLVDKYVRVGLHVRMYPFFSSEAIAVSFGRNKIMSEHNGDCLRSGGQILPFLIDFAWNTCF